MSPNAVNHKPVDGLGDQIQQANPGTKAHTLYRIQNPLIFRFSYYH